MAAAELLARRGARVTLTDRKPQIPGGRATARRRRRARARAATTPTSFERADLIVLSPGVPIDLPEVAARAGRRRAGDRRAGARLALAARPRSSRSPAPRASRRRRRWSAGCSKRRASACWSAATSACRSARRSTPRPPTPCTSIEASSFQLETTDTFHPWIAALLNFSPDHLDRHPDEAAYAAAKARIFANQRPDDWAVVNADSPEALTMADERARRAS